MLKFFVINDDKKIKKLINNIEKVNNFKKEIETKPTKFPSLKFNLIKGCNKFLCKRRYKIKNMVNDLHWKTVNLLCKNFNNIYIGKMSTKDIVKKHGNLAKSTKKYCYALSHFTFRERLKSKAEEYKVNVKEVCEAYTSKTCGGCGKINKNLGSSKVFKCPTCSFKIGRDINGARNILIKHM